MANIINAETINNVKADWMKVGMALISTRLLTVGNFSDATAMEWAKSSLLTLIGFTIYQVAARKAVDTDVLFKQEFKALFDDILKFGTMFIFARLLSGESMRDPDWIKSTLYKLLGLGFHNVVLTNVVDLDSMKPKAKLVSQDVLKFSSMYGIERLFMGGEFDAAWTKGVGSEIFGYTLYSAFLA